jgi:hypothetical protein
MTEKAGDERESRGSRPRIKARIKARIKNPDQEPGFRTRMQMKTTHHRKATEARTPAGGRTTAAAPEYGRTGKRQPTIGFATSTDDLYRLYRWSPVQNPGQCPDAPPPARNAGGPKPDNSGL